MEHISEFTSKTDYFSQEFWWMFKVLSMQNYVNDNTDCMFEVQVNFCKTII